MRSQQIEEWALRTIERVENRQPNEDSRIELKADWPDEPEKAARRIAGHANTMRGEPILWIIGLDEVQGVTGASQNNLANWWPQVKAQFDGPTPELFDVLVYSKGRTVVALLFESTRVPYVTRNPVHGRPNGGPVQWEVPWRDGTATRTATHSDLILLLSPLQRATLNVEVGNGRGFVHSCPLANPVGPSKTAWYVRVRALNVGRATARNCMCYLANVEFWRDDEFQETCYADFLPLVWSYQNGRPVDLLPQVPHWFDLISTLDHDDRFFLETDPKAQTYLGGFAEKGTYRFTVRLFAEDAEPAEAYAFVGWDGRWNSPDVFSHAEWEARRR